MSEIGQNLIAEVRRLADDNPDFIYENICYENICEKVGVLTASCAYVFKGQPSCLIGRAAWNLGLIDAGMEFQDVNTAGVDELAAFKEWPLSNMELMWLNTAQDQQDCGHKWRDAVAKADGCKDQVLA